MRRHSPPGAQRQLLLVPGSGLLTHIAKWRGVVQNGHLFELGFADTFAMWCGVHEEKVG